VRPPGRRVLARRSGLGKDVQPLAMGRTYRMKVLDTSFLIDLQREWTQKQEGAATGFLRAHSSEEYAISVITVVEFLEGYETLIDGERFIEPFEWVDATASIARKASRLRRRLRSQGITLGDFDILIAATALELEAPLVTADTRHFTPVDNLALESYR